jgi:hypothetical protein
MKFSLRSTLYGCVFGSAFAGALLLPVIADAVTVPGASRGSVFEYIATAPFADGAKAFYLKAIASDANRQKMVEQAKDDCGGRYEGTAVSLVELSHVVDVDKHPPEHPGRTYAVEFATEATMHWLVAETISCSVHGGHNQSLLRAVLLTGTETERVTYHYVNDRETGKPEVNDVKRVYKIDGDALTDQYNVPYSQQ